MQPPPLNHKNTKGMKLNNKYEALGEIPIQKDKVTLPLIADVTGTWAFMSSFNGSYQYMQFEAEVHKNMIVPVELLTDTTYTFRLYKPDNTIHNDTYYVMITVKDEELTSSPPPMQSNDKEYREWLVGKLYVLCKSPDINEYPQNEFYTRLIAHIRTDEVFKEESEDYPCSSCGCYTGHESDCPMCGED